MPTVIRNQQYALLSAEAPTERETDSRRYFAPRPIDARDEEEAQDLALIHMQAKGLKGMYTLVKLIADYRDGSGPDAVYVSKE